MDPITLSAAIISTLVHSGKLYNKTKKILNKHILTATLADLKEAENISSILAREIEDSPELFEELKELYNENAFLKNTANKSQKPLEPGYQPICLSAENFIKALQGKIVHDLKTGKSHNFLTNKYVVDEYTYKNVVVIDQVFVSESIHIDRIKDERILAFDYPVILLNNTFQSEFIIFDGVFKQDFRISNGEFLSSFIISGGVFQNRFIVENSVFQSSFKIRGGTFNEQTIILGGNFKHPFILEEGEFKKPFSVQGGRFKDFSIRNGIFRKHFVIEQRALFGELSILGGEFQQSLYIDTYGFIEQLVFDCFVRQEIVVKKNARIKDLIFRSGITKQGTILIQSKVVNRLSFENFVNKGVLEITDMKGVTMTPIPNPDFSLKRHVLTERDIKGLTWFDSDPKIKLTNSNLGNTVFIGVAFESFSQILLNNTKINSISTIGKHFPINRTTVGNEIDLVGKPIPVPSEMAQVYQQLSIAMHLQGDFSKEKEYHKEHLYWQDKAKGSFLTPSFSTFFRRSQTIKTKHLVYLIGLLSTIFIIGYTFSIYNTSVAEFNATPLITAIIAIAGIAISTFLTMRKEKRTKKDNKLKWKGLRFIIQEQETSKSELKKHLKKSHPKLRNSDLEKVLHELLSEKLILPSDSKFSTVTFTGAKQVTGAIPKIKHHSAWQAKELARKFNIDFSDSDLTHFFEDPFKYDLLDILEIFARISKTINESYPDQTNSLILRLPPKGDRDTTSQE